MNRIGHAQERILFALAKYKYLTVSQMRDIGILKDRRNIARKVKELRDQKLVQSTVFGFFPGIGKVDNVNFLGPKAKALLQEFGLEDEEIRIPIGRQHYTNDYFHRRYTIDFHILVSQWAEVEGANILFFDTYFDKTGNNRKGKNLRAKTKIDLAGDKYIIPDAVCKIELPDFTHQLFLLEIHNGKDSLRIFNQLKKHIYVLSTGATNEKYEYGQAYHILCVFEHESIMQALMKRMQQANDFMYTTEHFLFKPLSHLKETNIMHGWTNYKGDKVNLV